ncbi:glycosyltransferase family 2 protein [Litchfieldia salsa]|uniref:Glycosyl transferase family 2 n=1 Tax=Litchfieldia salsa TaxID=930152 RepID=A0A1H0WX07_9BACI|nr:glycosyltransferase family 2 protein [Litchfieldia salsa]SDP94955.1 Glycosyl transferase family 2 [Litchfieldia salsa]
MKVSVCMATYNGEGFIIRQLESVLKQLRSDDEVIIVDDCSKDQTVNVIKEKYESDQRVQLFVNQSNFGVIKSFEKAISLAQGDIIFLCDQDDIWEDMKVQSVLATFESQNPTLVVHDAEVVDGKLEMIHSSWNTYNHNAIDQGLLGNVVKNAYTGCMMAFKSDIVPSIIPFPKTIEMHDQWIALVCMIKKKKIIHLNEPLMKYVRHGGNATAITKRSVKDQLSGRIRTITALASYRNKQ